MTKILFVALCLFIGGASFDASCQNTDPARELVRESLAGMGGENKIKKIKTLSLQGVGHTYFLEQSERPEGPWIVNYEQVEQIRDYERRRLFLQKETRNVQQPQWQGSALIYEDEVPALKLPENRIVPGRPANKDELVEVLEFAPEQILLEALEAGDLKTNLDTIIQGVRHHAVSFTHGTEGVKIFINANTSLPTLLQVNRTFPQDLMWSLWGEVKVDTFFSFWSLTEEGVKYPMQYNVFRNGQPFREFTVLDLKINPAVADSTFSIPDNLKSAYLAQPSFEIADLPLGRPDQPAKELAPGLLLIPGYWNVAVIKQDDGVLLLEAPISDKYTAKALAEVRRLHPGEEISGVISTSDAWPHVGGIGQCDKENLPIYALDLNKPFLERLISAKRKNLSAGQIPAQKRSGIHPISAKTTIGTGTNRVEVYPIAGESSERMLMVYFPEHRLLYASDLVQQNRDGSFFQKAYLSELIVAVDRYGLKVDNVFAMHTDIIPYQKIKDALQFRNAL